MNKIEFETIIGLPNDISYIIEKNIYIYPTGYIAKKILIGESTKGRYTNTNAQKIAEWVITNASIIEAWKIEIKSINDEKNKQHKEWLKTPEGKWSIMRKKALDLAIKAGLQHDEHGGYGSGDYHTLSIQDCVMGKKNLAKYHGTGHILAIVSDERTRVYSKAYMRNFCPGHRTDVYLLGENENGIPFLHSVSKNCKTVEEAINWIWHGKKIANRHGDIAVSPSSLKKSGKFVEDISIHDNHHFTGEMIRNGSTYMRNGTLHHTKDQHPDIQIGNEWMRVIIGKRTSIGGTSD